MQQNNQAVHTEVDTIAEKIMPVIELTVSMDKMAAYMRVKPAFEGQEITAKDLFTFLERQDIKYGVKENDIKEFCEEKRFFSELTCAEASPAVHQEAASLSFEFDTQNEGKPKEREDGTMDFRDLDLVQNVSKGTVLCRLVVPPDGSDGVDIYGNVVAHQQAKLPAFPAGKNTEVTEDERSLISSIDGCIEYRNGIVNVEDVYTVKGDVDISSGNIDFTGSVNVHGDVREGFSIKSGGDVFITGMAEGATVESAGSIAISKGMNGMLKGMLTASKDVTGKFFENATIECGGNVYADVLLNCTVRAGGCVILKGKRSLLIGGHCRAGQMVYTNTIGSDNHIHTSVAISSPLLNSTLSGDKETEANGEIQELQETLQMVTLAAVDLQKQIQLFASKPNKTDKERAVIKLLLSKKAKSSGEASHLQKNIKEKQKCLQENIKATTDFKVVATSRIYPGVKLTIGPFTQNVETEYSNTKVYTDSENMMFAPISPADKMDSF